MDIIIRLIISIFEALFEKDVNQRNQMQSGSSRSGQEQNDTRADEIDMDQVEAWLSQTLGIDVQVSRKVDQVKAPPEPPPLPQPVQPQPETFDAHMSRTTSDMSHLDVDVMDHLGKSKVYGQRRAHKSKRLPGRKPLAQAIWARTILEPCPAAKRFRKAQR